MKQNFGDRVSVATIAEPEPAATTEDEKPDKPADQEFEFSFLPRDVKAHLDRFVIKQEEAKKVLAIAGGGVAAGSLTWNLRDVAVKGHLPRSETTRVKRLFVGAPAGAARVLVIHHNILPGAISRRMGLARWRSAQRRLVDTGVDVVLCGHDHQEGAGQMEAVAVSTAGTHSFRTRHGRPSVFNIVRVEPFAVHVLHYRWEAAQQRFLESDRFSFARRAAPEPVVSETGGIVGTGGV